MFRTLFGGLLVAAGILIAGASGLCSLAVIGSAFRNPTNLGAIPTVLFFGAVPFGLGVLLIFGGMGLIRSGRKGPKVW